MQILLELPEAKRLLEELKRARGREIGGLLMGEYLGDEMFRLAELTVQRDGGTRTHFQRDPTKHKEQLDEFFRRTSNDYARFNYLGEWHSHPTFAPFPSEEDIASMQELVEDASTNVNFLVLIIVRLTGAASLEMTATAFRPQSEPIAVQVTAETRGDNSTPPEEVNPSASERPNS
jgi:integrative and conjugative element protein (TIGR02256 family)